jgi:Uma2 family endonuclease
MSDPGADVPRGGLTYADYAALPDDGRRYQLVEGELVVSQSPNSLHQVVSGELHVRLRAHVDALGLGRVLFAPLDVVLDDRNVVQPDLLFIARTRMSVLGKANVQGAPDLAVEILSPETERLDRTRKLDLYARHGVAHYWIVDLDSRTIEEYVLAGDVYRVRGVAGRLDTFRPALFPGFEFVLGSVALPGEMEP